MFTLTHVNEIVEEYSKKRLNRSTKYLFPLLYDGFNVIASNVTNIEQNGFTLVNLYIGDALKPEYDSHILMLLNIKDFENENFKLFFEDVKLHHLFLEYYNVDINYIMIVFKLTEKEQPIYNYFIRGRYSKFPEYYKKIFQSGFEAPLTSAYNVTTRNPLLRHKLEQELNVKIDSNAELDDIPNKKEEIFRTNED